MNFFRFLFLDAHREVLSLLTGELTEESDQFRFLWTVRLGNLKGFVDSIRHSLGNEGYVVFHTSPSLLSLSSCPPSSYSFPSLISSTLCLSGT